MALLMSAVVRGTAAPASASAGPHDTSTWIGSNYTPAYAANQVQMWHDFQPEVIERELAAASRQFGLNTVRVYLHYINYREEKALFVQRIEQFLTICQKHGVRPGFTFFDDCWNHKDITLETPPPVDGRHNGRWAAVQDIDRKDENLAFFKAYVQDIVRPHVNDKRVLWWEVYNEPNRQDRYTQKLCENGYRWIKELAPAQPVICCWSDNPETEIVNAHSYDADFGPGGGWDRQADANPAKGAVFTEAGARWYAGKPASNGSPTEVMRWLRRRRAEGKTTPGVYLCWELMVGNSHCRWYWGTADGAPEPPIPWCGLLWPDGTPVSYAEAEAVRSYAAGEKRALLAEDFAGAKAPVQDPAGWKRYQAGAQTSASRLTLTGQSKLVAGDITWSNYLLETTLMLKSGEGNAGLIFRVNDPGPNPDQMRGYYAGIDRHTLYLGKMNNNWKALATVDLAKIGRSIDPNAWNLLRVAVQGDRIRVWLNPRHDDTAAQIDLRDQDQTVLKGCVGVRTLDTEAWFADVVVLPVEVLNGN